MGCLGRTRKWERRLSWRAGLYAGQEKHLYWDHALEPRLILVEGHTETRYSGTLMLGLSSDLGMGRDGDAPVAELEPQFPQHGDEGRGLTLFPRTTASVCSIVNKSQKPEGPVFTTSCPDHPQKQDFPVSSIREPAGSSMWALDCCRTIGRGCPRVWQGRLAPERGSCCQMLPVHTSLRRSVKFSP